MKRLHGFGMQFERALKHTLKVADGNAVVGHRHVLTLGLCKTREHVASRYNATAALQNEFVGCQIHGEVFTDHDLDIQFASDFFG